MGLCATTEEYEKYQIYKSATKEFGFVELHHRNERFGDFIHHSRYTSEASTSSMSDRNPHKEHWGYDKLNGPHTWGDTFPDCCGFRQSPVNIDSKAVVMSFPTAKPQTIRFNYHNGSAICTNDGRNVAVVLNEPAGDILIFNEEAFSLIQFHFHCPSEHMIDGRQYPLEIQFVHQQQKTGELAIVSHLYTDGDKGDVFIDDIIKGKTPPRKKESYRINWIDYNLLNPERKNYVHYDGSLTQPPCTENVAWFINSDLFSCSREQLAWLREALPFDNARPIQNIHNRELTKCTGYMECNVIE